MEGLVNATFLHLFGDSLRLDSDDWLSESHNFSFGVLSDVACGSLLEDNDLLFVLLQSLDVSAEVFSGFVSSSGVNADADLFGFSSAHTGVLEFFVRETSSNSGLGVVSEGWALDNGSERTGDWSWGDSGGLGGSSGSSGDLFGWLVKPGLGEFGPCLSLSEMRVWEDSVKMNGHFLNFCKFDLRL